MAVRANSLVLVEYAPTAFNRQPFICILNRRVNSREDSSDPIQSDGKEILPQPVAFPLQCGRVALTAQSLRRLLRLSCWKETIGS